MGFISWCPVVAPCILIPLILRNRVCFTHILFVRLFRHRTNDWNKIEWGNNVEWTVYMFNDYLRALRPMKFSGNRYTGCKRRNHSEIEQYQVALTSAVPGLAICRLLSFTTWVMWPADLGRVGNDIALILSWRLAKSSDSLSVTDSSHILVVPSTFLIKKC